MPKKLIKFITQEEFEKVFDAVNKVNGTSIERKKQYKLALLLGFESGMRISEIVGYKDIVPELTKDMIEVASIRIEQGKGQKDRIVPRPKRMNEKAIKMLPLNIKRRALQDFTTKLCKNILNKELTFHSFRHGFGSHLAGQGRPLHEIQMLMGHSRLDTTGIYLHANPKEAIDGARDVF